MDAEPVQPSSLEAWENVPIAPLEVRQRSKDESRQRSKESSENSLTDSRKRSKEAAVSPVLEDIVDGQASQESQRVVRRQQSLRQGTLIYRLSSLKTPLIIDVPLRGFGQVIFCDNDISGLAFLVALVIGDPWLAVLASIGCITGVLVGVLAHFDGVFIRMGLTGYNGVLVGCGFAVFLNNEPWTLRPVLATIVGGGVQAFITLSSANMSTVPAWTFPFNYVLLASLLMFQEATNPEPEIAVVTGPSHLSEIPIVDVLKAIPIGISQIFIVNNWISGVLIVLGVACHDTRLAVSVVVGSVIGLVLAICVEADPVAITSGLWGYNPSLTAAAICVFFQHTRQMLGLVLWGCIATQVLSAGMAKGVGEAFNIPICTLPFSIMATFCYMLRNHLKGYETPHTLSGGRSNARSSDRLYSVEEDATECSDDGEEKTVENELDLELAASNPPPTLHGSSNGFIVEQSDYEKAFGHAHEHTEHWKGDATKSDYEKAFGHAHEHKEQWKGQAEMSDYEKAFSSAHNHKEVWGGAPASEHYRI